MPSRGWIVTLSIAGSIAGCTERGVVPITPDPDPIDASAEDAGRAPSGDSGPRPDGAPDEFFEGDAGIVDPGEPDAFVPIDAPPEPPPPDPTCVEWTSSTFAFPADGISCSGAQWIRFVPEQALWAGLVECPGGGMRFYLAEAAGGPYLPATDLGGHGQDFCELVVPGFTLASEDDITSGGCAACTIGPNHPIEGALVYARARLGERFERQMSGAWSWQTAVVGCGVAIAEGCTD